MTRVDVEPPLFTRKYMNVASPRYGTAVIEASDEFFADKARLIKDAEPVYIPGKYDDHGKWMDGWESRRRRGRGHDWCIIELGVKSQIFGVEIDTTHFTGNYPPGASIDGCADAARADEPDAWVSLLPTVDLAGDRRHFFAIENDAAWALIRLNIYPDGGVARLRLFGKARPDWPADTGELIELSALRNGGRIVRYNDAHFGDVQALLAPGRGVTMGDGWETRRRREPGNDWIIIALGAPGVIHDVEIDTAHFKGNFPQSASLQAAYVTGETSADIATSALFWDELLPNQPLSADAVHRFSLDKMLFDTPVTHVKLNIFPDGGISRLRVFGRRAE